MTGPCGRENINPGRAVSKIWIQETLLDEELATLKEEFPQFQFKTRQDEQKLAEEDWDSVEIFFGDTLSPEDVKQANQLRWVQLSTPLTNLETLEYIRSNSSILLSETQSDSVDQMAEFALAGILMFAKQLTPSNKEIWTLKNKTLLQVGVGYLSRGLMKTALHFGMKVWGVSERRSTYPHCNKSFVVKEMNSLLPNADVVAICTPREKMRRKPWLGESELELMKDDAVILSLETLNAVDETALSKLALQGKFRGIVIDTPSHLPLSKDSPLHTVPQAIISCGCSQLPESSQRTAFHTFRYNLRHFVRGNFLNMKNILHTSEEIL